MEHSQNRPSLRTLVIVLAVVAVIVALGVVTSEYAITALVTMLICAGVIGWWIWRNRKH